MKPLLSFFLLCTFLSLVACSGDDPSPIEQLPPATQSGAHTFGCLINGKAFTPKGGGFGGPDRGASYQFVYNNGDSFFNFQVFGNRNKEEVSGITLNLKFSEFDDLSEDKTYAISSYENGGEGLCFVNGYYHMTNNEHTGTLTITHYDYDKRIISGTFEFEVEVDGKVFKVTDGRFDMEFTL